jgi:hypothetical protein
VLQERLARDCIYFAFCELNYLRVFGDKVSVTQQLADAWMGCVRNAKGTGNASDRSLTSTPVYTSIAAVARAPRKESAMSADQVALAGIP